MIRGAGVRPPDGVRPGSNGTVVAGVTAWPGSAAAGAAATRNVAIRGLRDGVPERVLRTRLRCPARRGAS